MISSYTCMYKVMNQSLPATLNYLIIINDMYSNITPDTDNNCLISTAY